MLTKEVLKLHKIKKWYEKENLTFEHDTWIQHNMWAQPL